MANFGRGKDKKKRKSRNILGKVGAGLAGVGLLGAGAYLGRKNLANLGNRVKNKINRNMGTPLPELKPKGTPLPELKPKPVNRPDPISQAREIELQKQMKSMNDTNEQIRLAKEAKKAAKRQSNMKRQRSDTNTTNRGLVKEANRQKDNKTLSNLFKDVDDSAAKLDDFDILPSKSKSGQGFGNSQPKSNKKKKGNKASNERKRIG